MPPTMSLPLDIEQAHTVPPNIDLCRWTLNRPRGLLTEMAMGSIFTQPLSVPFGSFKRPVDVGRNGSPTTHLEPS